MYEDNAIYDELNKLSSYLQKHDCHINNTTKLGILALHYGRSHCNYTKEGNVKSSVAIGLNFVGLTTSTNEMFHLRKKRVIAFLRNEFRLLEQN